MTTREQQIQARCEVDTPEERADRIMKVEGFTFALACLAPQKELAEATAILKAAIAREIRAALTKETSNV